MNTCLKVTIPAEGLYDHSVRCRQFSSQQVLVASKTITVEDGHLKVRSREAGIVPGVSSCSGYSLAGDSTCKRKWFHGLADELDAGHSDQRPDSAQRDGEPNKIAVCCLNFSPRQSETLGQRFRFHLSYDSDSAGAYLDLPLLGKRLCSYNARRFESIHQIRQDAFQSWNAFFDRMRRPVKIFSLSRKRYHR